MKPSVAMVRAFLRARLEARIRDWCDRFMSRCRLELRVERTESIQL